MDYSPLRAERPGLIGTARCGPARRVVWQPGLAYWVSPRRANWPHFPFHEIVLSLSSTTVQPLFVRRSRYVTVEELSPHA